MARDLGGPHLTHKQRYIRAANEQRLARERASRGPTPERITMALDYCALHGPEVDRALGGEEPMVDEWEAGTRRPTDDQIEALARLTDFPIGWFYQPPPRPISLILCGDDGCETVEMYQPPPAEVIDLFGDGRLW